MISLSNRPLPGQKPQQRQSESGSTVASESRRWRLTVRVRAQSRLVFKLPSLTEAFKA